MLSRKTILVLILLALVAVVVGVYSPFAPAGRQTENTGSKARAPAQEPVNSPSVSTPGTQPSIFSSWKDNLQTVKYATGDMTAIMLMEVLRHTSTKAQFISGEDGKTLIVAAPPAEHEKIRNAITSLRKKTIDVEQMDIIPTGTPPYPPGKAVDSKDEPRAKISATVKKNLETLMAVLRRTVPEAQLSVGEDGKKLMVIAKPPDHKTIIAIIESLDREKVVEIAEVFLQQDFRFDAFVFS